MSENKFTPGPWKVRERMYDRAVDSESGLVCGLSWHKGDYEANATLIAAAPDLYVALKNLLQKNSAANLSAAVEALDKAEGRPNTVSPKGESRS